MSGFIEISPEQAWAMVQAGEAILADVRRAEHFALAHAPEAVNLTEQTWGALSQEWDYDQPIILSCYHGISSRSVASYLAQQGYEKLYSVIGGFQGWEEARLPLVSELS